MCRSPEWCRYIPSVYVLPEVNGNGDSSDGFAAVSLDAHLWCQAMAAKPTEEQLPSPNSGAVQPIDHVLLASSTMNLTRLEDLLEFTSWTARVTSGRSYHYTYEPKKGETDITGYKFECCFVGASATAYVSAVLTGTKQEVAKAQNQFKDGSIWDLSKIKFEENSNPAVIGSPLKVCVDLARSTLKLNEDARLTEELATSYATEHSSGSMRLLDSTVEVQCSGSRHLHSAGVAYSKEQANIANAADGLQPPRETEAMQRPLHADGAS